MKLDHLSVPKIAVLIDADNTPPKMIPSVMTRISSYGRVAAKKAFGNWSKDTLKSWKTIIGEYGISAEQQFDFVTGKNATDIALTIVAMDLLYHGIYDIFVVVSSDSDYTPLLNRLRESGIYVVGIGKTDPPRSLVGACDEFHSFGSLGAVDKASPPPPIHKNDIDYLHELLVEANSIYRDANGYTQIGAVGSFIKNNLPDFEARNYGFKKLPNLIEAFPNRYETTTLTPVDGKPPIFAYRCLDTTTLKESSSSPSAHYSPKMIQQRKMVLDHLFSNPGASRNAISSILGVKYDRTREILETLIRDNMIFVLGKLGKKRYYLPSSGETIGIHTTR